MLVGDRKDSATYVRSKKRACEKIGLRSFGYDLPADVGEAELLALIARLNADADVHGILVQVCVVTRIFDIELRLIFYLRPIRALVASVDLVQVLLILISFEYHSRPVCLVRLRLAPTAPAARAPQRISRHHCHRAHQGRGRPTRAERRLAAAARSGAHAADLVHTARVH